MGNENEKMNQRQPIIIILNEKAVEDGMGNYSSTKG